MKRTCVYSFSTKWSERSRNDRGERREGNTWGRVCILWRRTTTVYDKEEFENALVTALSSADHPWVVLIKYKLNANGILRFLRIQKLTFLIFTAI